MCPLNKLSLIYKKDIYLYEVFEGPVVLVLLRKNAGNFSRVKLLDLRKEMLLFHV